MALAVKHRLGEQLEFELVEDSRPQLLSERRQGAGQARRHRHRRAAAPFASVSMQSAAASSSSSSTASRRVPAFVVASAAESKPLNLEGVPQWRITAGNLAAGATAGCAVEAGGSFPVHAAALWHARIALRSSLGACLTSTERGGMSMSEVA